MQRPSGKSNVYNFYASPQSLNLKANDYVYMKSKRFQHRPSQLADFDLPRHSELRIDATKSMSINKIARYVALLLLLLLFLSSLSRAYVVSST
jgi:hypothetical protein